VFSFTQLLLLHGYYFIFCYVFAVGLGLPIPADPLLLIMGALAGDHHYNFLLTLAVSVVPAVLADYFWYELGRVRGHSVLRLICKLAIEPDTCVRSTEATFAKRGSSALYFAKFVPGMSLVSMPMAGLIGMSRRRFLLADTIGCVLWISSYMLLGALFHRQVESLIVQFGLFGRSAGAVVGCILVFFIGFKYLQRWRILREIRTNRITPPAVHELLNNPACKTTIVDLRHPTEVERDNYKIPGALILRPEQLRALAREIPPEHEIILYCT
jgi:membrane protein DedA with SNARE-associated domain